MKKKIGIACIVVIIIAVILGIVLTKRSENNTTDNKISVTIEVFNKEGDKYSSNQTIFGYIWQGILFNYKYVFFNIIAVGIIYAFDILIDKIEGRTQPKKEIIF